MNNPRGKLCEVNDGSLTAEGICVGGFRDVLVFKRPSPPYLPEQYFTIVVNEDITIKEL